MLEEGDKLLIAHRRLFDRDEPRYFVGQVLAYQNGLAKVRGYSFVRDAMTGNFLRKNELRVKLVSVVSGSFLIYQLADDVEIDSTKFELHDTELVLTDGQGLKMNMAEQPHRGEI